jgi:glycosyltransferase involved in cell wall biosynthesis
VRQFGLKSAIRRLLQIDPALYHLHCLVLLPSRNIGLISRISYVSNVEFDMKVTAIIPVYNGEPWLTEAITSIKNQTRAVDELIVVDDGSTDNSAEIARNTGAKVIQLAKNSGEGAARNAGLHCAVGDVITWLDADDFWAPKHVEILHSLLERYPRATAAFAAVRQFGLRNELIEGYIPIGEPVNVFWAAFDDWVHTTIGSMTCRGPLLAVGGFSTDQRSAVDYDLWLRLSREHLFVCTHEVTSFWRWHPKQQSQDRASQLRAVYYFRHRYWTKEQQTGDPHVAERLGKRIRFLWERDYWKALGLNDLRLGQSLLQCHRLVPGLDASALMRFRSFLYLRRLGALFGRFHWPSSSSLT